MPCTLTVTSVQSDDLTVAVNTARMLPASSVGARFVLTVWLERADPELVVGDDIVRHGTVRHRRLGTVAVCVFRKT